MKERKLGRSLSDLISENTFDIGEDEVVREILIEDIKPNPDQPRTYFDDVSIQELGESIKEHGIIQPIIVKPTAGFYTLVAGERRLRAAKMVGLKTVPSIVRDYNAIYLAELAILENLQREDLNAVEEALAFQKMVYKYGFTHEELGKKIGKSRVYVTNALGLLHLPEVVISGLVDRVITAGHARALSKIKKQDIVLSLYNKVIEEELNVRELEAIIREMNTSTITISDGLISKIKKEVKSLFHKEYSVTVSKKSVSFHFKNEDELQKIMSLLKKLRD